MKSKGTSLGACKPGINFFTPSAILYQACLIIDGLTEGYMEKTVLNLPTAFPMDAWFKEGRYVATYQRGRGL